MNTFKKDQQVEIRRRCYGCPTGSAHTCFGVVERVTARQVLVRDERGNLSRFWSESLRAVGYTDSFLRVLAA